MGVRLDMHQTTHDGFLWLKDSVCGVEPEPVEVMLHSSTINWVSQIHWSLGPAHGKTESSSKLV